MKLEKTLNSFIGIVTGWALAEYLFGDKDDILTEAYILERGGVVRIDKYDVQWIDYQPTDSRSKLVFYNLDNTISLTGGFNVFVADDKSSIQFTLIDKISEFKKLLNIHNR